MTRWQPSQTDKQQGHGQPEQLQRRIDQLSGPNSGRRGREFITSTLGIRSASCLRRTRRTNATDPPTTTVTDEKEVGMLEPDEDWMVGLSRTAQETVNGLVAERNSLSLAGMVEAWVASARRIASGAGDDYYDDYYIYVSWRHGIDELIAALPGPDAEIIRKAVEPADIEFRNHTVDDGGKALSQKFKSLWLERWYWRRVPVRGPIARSLGITEAS
jgi:hypothetical protein